MSSLPILLFPLSQMNTALQYRKGQRRPLPAPPPTEYTLQYTWKTGGHTESPLLVAERMISSRVQKRGARMVSNGGAKEGGGKGGRREGRGGEEGGGGGGRGGKGAVGGNGGGKGEGGKGAIGGSGGGKGEGGKGAGERRGKGGGVGGGRRGKGKGSVQEDSQNRPESVKKPKINGTSTSHQGGSLSHCINFIIVKTKQAM